MDLRPVEIPKMPLDLDAPDQNQDDDSSRIVGGVEATPHEFPHQVALLIDAAIFCGGSLIRKFVT